jgi:hypothetical protein
MKSLNIFSGTTKFKDKSIYLSLTTHKWKYLNNRTVHFNSSSASETEDLKAFESEDESEDDTARVNKLL